MGAEVPADAPRGGADELSPGALIDVLLSHVKLLVGVPILAGLCALGVTFLIAPTFTASTTFLPPQQQQSAAASTLASLGALSGLAGAAAGIKSPGEQYVSILQSTTVADRVVDAFKLMDVYQASFRVEARKELAQNVRIVLGKRDGLITVEVDDQSPQRAADMANRYVDELRRMASELALTEAQQRRVFFDAQLKQTRDKLAAAQKALQGTGFNQGALRAEPKTAAEGYARLKAEATAAEVRLQTLRRGLVDATPEVQQQQALLDALREQLAALEASSNVTGGSDYIGKYREFKYQETLFDLFARQYELARVDESREGPLIQVVDVAQPPEKKSRPRRGVTALVTTASTAVLLALLLLARQARSSRRPRLTT